MAVIRHDRMKPTYDIAAWILTGVSLVLILSLHLLPALLAGPSSITRFEVSASAPMG